MTIKLVNVGWKRFVVAEVDAKGNYKPLTEPASKPLAELELKEFTNVQQIPATDGNRSH